MILCFIKNKLSLVLASIGASLLESMRSELWLIRDTGTYESERKCAAEYFAAGQ